jgi:glucosamine-phosphate N-acetyltransferase
MSLTVRALRPDDVTAAFLETLGGLTEVSLTVAEARAILQLRDEQGVHTYVALDGGQVVGTASLLVELKFIHCGGKVGHIEDVAVHESRRRQGVGTALVAHLTEEARRLGCYKCVLNCFPHLVPFYDRLGYHKHDECLRIDL